MTLERIERIMGKVSSVLTWCAKHLDQKEYFSSKEVEILCEYDDLLTDAYCFLKKQ